MELLIIRGGRVIDPANNIDSEIDLVIENGRIKELRKFKKDIHEGSFRVCDASGKIVIPGLVDVHTHLREPGYEHKETIESGSRAAVAGGFSTICAMPNTVPVNDNKSVTELIIKRSQDVNLLNVYPIGAITKSSKGEELADFLEMKEAGVVGFSDDGSPVKNPFLMRCALEYAKKLDLPLISHCEDPDLSAGGQLNEGEVSKELGLKGIPNAAEDVMVERDLTLAEVTGSGIHIAHVSTKGAVRIIREAKARGLRVTAEATPHHFTLTDECLRKLDTNFKVNPPLRSRDDVEAIKEGLKDGTIDCISTDHAPHDVGSKEVEFSEAANGIVGLETALPLTLGLVEEGVISLNEAIAKLTTKPSRVLGLDKGTLSVGADADVTIMDHGKPVKIDVSGFRSKGKNSPFDGWELRGEVICTFYKGRQVFP